MAIPETTTKVADYKPYNFVDGEGVRCSLYVSGCHFACPGCYNKVAQNFNYGTPYTEELKERILSDLGASYCQGLTLLGGEPFLHTAVLIDLCQEVTALWPQQGYLVLDGLRLGGTHAGDARQVGTPVLCRYSSRRSFHSRTVRPDPAIPG